MGVSETSIPLRARIRSPAVWNISDEPRVSTEIVCVVWKRPKLPNVIPFLGLGPLGDRRSAVPGLALHAPRHSQQGICDTIFDDGNYGDQPHMVSVQGAKDELIHTVPNTVRSPPTDKQATILLGTF